MKKLLRSTFGTLVVAAFLAVAPPMYARGRHGGQRGGMVGTASNMPRPVMLRADTAPFVFAVGMATNLSGLRAAAGIMQGAQIIELAAVAGEVTTDVRTMDIPATV